MIMFLAIFPSVISIECRLPKCSFARVAIFCLQVITLDKLYHIICQKANILYDINRIYFIFIKHNKKRDYIVRVYKVLILTPKIDLLKKLLTKKLHYGTIL